MLRRLVCRVTYANVVATIALFLALTGGAVWAAQKISGRHIQKHSIPGNRLVDHSVSTRQLANPGSFTSLTTRNGWVDESTLSLPQRMTSTPLGFYIDREDFVHLHGAATGDSSTSNVIAQLPADAAPGGGSLNCVAFPVASDPTAGTVFICGDGLIYQIRGDKHFISLEGITFRRGE